MDSDMHIGNTYIINGGELANLVERSADKLSNVVVFTGEGDASNPHGVLAFTGTIRLIVTEKGQRLVALRVTPVKTQE